MRFKSPYFHDDFFISKNGKREEDDYVLAYNVDGIAYLKKVGVKPTYAKIQAARSECELEAVLQACIHDNQNIVPSLDFVESSISDFSQLHSLGDLFIASKNVQSMWNDLPLEVRENFDGNVHKFTMSINTPDFHDKLVDGYNRFSDSVLKRLDGQGSIIDGNPSPSIDVSTSIPDDKGGE